eukprot:CAMPEP_0194189678 /NCGR_PEP_ID=MMETSP0154-20130528/59815_1 /TAXON_ID=1049557 /ORGANISM="Thalassiothrix antarctica, Strain L6-D1" /LENGTH=199 /DNA_ID=CAMNT_0038910951 /DNA_START=12 /DNA_END=611 /DNA_ORIENTATION=+
MNLHYRLIIILSSYATTVVVGAACQACMFSAPVAISRQKDQLQQNVPLTSKSRGAGLMPYGFLAARHIMKNRVRPWMVLQSQRSDDDGDNEEGASSEKNGDFLLNNKDDKKEKEEDKNLVSGAAINAIRFYKYWISPLLPPACRFVPTCSQYGVQAIEEHGPAKGAVLTSWRLLRCSPFGGRGYDPPKWPPVAYNYGSY